MVTVAQLQQIFPKAKAANLAAFCDEINEAAVEFEIDSPRRLAAFLAQCAHESGLFAHVRENLNYSAQGLRGIWPKRFPTLAAAQPYHRNPQKIANKVYADRMGNGPEASGDGWSYRGRGLIQLTGKSNYIACSAGLEYDVVADPDYLETTEGAARSAAWYWYSRNLNKWADLGDIKTMTKLINGGYIGLEEREHFYHSALSVLGGH
jgi:putative chitinase